MIQYKYALDGEGNLVDITRMAKNLRGKACNCKCLSCGKSMIARIGNGKVTPHFAHYTKNNCNGETYLHELGKKIISEEKCVMLPPYKGLHSKMLMFESVEVEERNDNKAIQPDVVGITKDGLRLHIEIFVTHRVDEEKNKKISEGGYNCLEIKISKDFINKDEELKDFLINSIDSRWFVNYPYGDNLVSIEKEKRHKELLEYQKQYINEYRSRHPKQRCLLYEKCSNCNIMKEYAKAQLEDFKSRYKNIISSWVLPILQLTPEQIFEKEIIMKRLKKNGSLFVYYENKPRFIYSNNLSKGECDNTFEFFKNYPWLCAYYIAILRNKVPCHFMKKTCVYDNVDYVFCDKNSCDNIEYSENFKRRAKYAHNYFDIGDTILDLLARHKRTTENNSSLLENNLNNKIPKKNPSFKHIDESTNWWYRACLQEALHFGTVEDYARVAPGAYEKAVENGWLSEYVWLERSAKNVSPSYPSQNNVSKTE